MAVMLHGPLTCNAMSHNSLLRQISIICLSHITTLHYSHITLHDSNGPQHLHSTVAMINLTLFSPVLPTPLFSPALPPLHPHSSVLSFTPSTSSLPSRSTSDASQHQPARSRARRGSTWVPYVTYSSIKV